jgi:hypothetical protein
MASGLAEPCSRSLTVSVSHIRYYSDAFSWQQLTFSLVGLCHMWQCQQQQYNAARVWPTLWGAIQERVPVAPTENQVCLPVSLHACSAAHERNPVASHMLLISGVKLLSAHIANLRTMTLVIRRHTNRMYSVEVIETKLGSYAAYVLRYTQWFQR